MTDRYHSLKLISAIEMIKGVLSVNPHVSDVGTHMAETRAHREMEAKLMAVLAAR